MAITGFATVAELATALQMELADLDETLAQQLIDSAAATVQAVTGQSIVQATSTTVIDLDEYDYGPWLQLPQRPVSAVATVLIGTTAVTDYRVQGRKARLWRAGGWQSPYGLESLTTYGRYAYSQPSTVTVTYTHGYAPSDPLLTLAKSTVLMLAGSQYGAPTAGVVREQLDDYSVQYASGAEASGAGELGAVLTAQLRRLYALPARSARLISGR